jgi:hypothetical protein
MRDQHVRQITGLADFIGGKPRPLRVCDVTTPLNISEDQFNKLAAAQGPPSFTVGGSVGSTLRSGPLATLMHCPLLRRVTAM